MTALAATPAFAGDSERFYAGLFAGAGQATDLAIRYYTDPYGNSYGAQNGQIGALAGFEFDHGNWFHGAEADVAAIFGDAYDNSNYIAYTEAYWNVHLRGKVGYDFGPARVFAAGGLALLNVDFDEIGYNKYNTLLTGYTVGAGVEVQHGDNWLLRLEALYDVYPDQKTSTSDYNAKWTETTVRAAAIFNFD